MGFDVNAVSSRTNGGWGALSGSALDQYKTDTKDAFEAVKAGNVSVQVAADALHVSPDALQHYMDQMKGPNAVDEDTAVNNMAAQTNATRSYIKQFLDDLLAKFKEAFPG
jgi:hypothetical protein